jgi:3-phosphoshikimate 1-carboxyvinyltransferase
MIDYTLPLEALPDPLPIEPLEKPFDVTITPPGSKSITNRAYVLAALADGESRIIRPLRSDDCDNLLNALCTLGAEARWEGEDVFIRGVNGRFPRGGEVNLGDGGAPTRFMIACACLAAEPVIVDGSPRMRQRPIAEGVDMLRQLGADIEYVQEEGRLPVRVVPSLEFRGGKITFTATKSSQSLSALLLIAPVLRSGLEWHVTDESELTSAGYFRMTIRLLAAWSVEWSTRGNKQAGFWTGVPFQGIHSRRYHVEADASSALYWVAAVALLPRSKASVIGLGHHSDDPIQPDMHAVTELMRKKLIGVTSERTEAGECRLQVQQGRRTAKLKCDCSLFPDGSLALATVAATLSKTSTFTGLHTLPMKETDRIAALANELRKIGCTVETTEDSITIDPSTRHDEPVVIETYNDHRMAMAFGVLGLARPGISIANPKCVKKSYPGFWADFAKLYQ